MGDVRGDSREQNIHRWGLVLHRPVFFVVAGLLAAFLAGTLLLAEPARALLEGILGWVRSTFDPLFLLAANAFLLLCLALIVSPYGHLRIGGDGARPEFGRLSWLTMLFAAGMGIGLMFWAVAEPVAYYTGWLGTPLAVAPGSEEAATLALGATLYHWGVHPWAIYSLVALALAFFCYNKGLPLTVRSLFHPLLGDRVWGPVGHAVDTVAVLATLFGLATSLGLGAQQVSSGLSALFTAVPDTLGTQVVMIAVVTGVAAASVWRGLHGGLRVLSNLNLSAAGLLMLFVILTGGVLGFVAALATGLASYVTAFLPLSQPAGRPDPEFAQTWTVFYWAWWISWSPFVGMFIARISYGRSVRELLAAVLLVPAAVTALWVSALGGQGISQVRGEVGGLAEGLGDDASMALFHLLERLPWTELTVAVAVLLVVIFFVTSADSGSRVLDAMTAGGELETPARQRIIWVVLMGALAGVLLFVGGEAALEALQAGTVTLGLPFAALMLLGCVSLVLGLHREHRSRSAPYPVAAPLAAGGLTRREAAAAAYVLGPITGLLLLAWGRHDPVVRFHAAQSVVCSGALLLLAALVGVLSVSVAGVPVVGWLGLLLLLGAATAVWARREPGAPAPVTALAGRLAQAVAPRRPSS